MVLTPEQKQKRDGKLTASAVAVLMTGDKHKIRELWRELTGDPHWVPEDLSDVWPVQLGATTEPLHIAWLRRKWSISRCGEVVISPFHAWAACTLDGWLDHGACPIEVKHVNGFEQREVIVQRYFPQMTWQMLITGARQCLFSVIEGAREPVQEMVMLDTAYADTLMFRAQSFMTHVWNMTEPVELDPIEPPVTATKEYDLSSNNVFVSAAADWLETRLATKRNETAAKTIKQCTPADAMRVIGGGIEVARDRANRLRISEKQNVDDKKRG